MNILLINPPYQTITSNFGVGHQVPLGLLMVGGPLIDAGHRVKLLDAECRRLRLTAIVKAVGEFGADVVMTGHAGSTPAHPVCLEMLRAIKAAHPQVKTVYGGVYPTYHARDILAAESAVDAIVRGEGEATAAELVKALSLGEDAVATVSGLACRLAGRIILTPDRPPIPNLDACRTGWELIENWNAYRCFGLGRAAIIQFSRGCPHRCTYCGQHGFWVKWRRRDPVKLADEIEWLRRKHGVRFITLADENPTTLRRDWERFLTEIARRQLGVHFFATIRATDIVRDADILDLYRKAGIVYVLMGIDSTSEQVLKEIKKGSSTRQDYHAARLLKKHGIFSVIGHIVGLRDETPATFDLTLRQLVHYDGDWLNAMYATPHDWTPFARATADRTIVEPNQRKWDYRHQVLGQKWMTRRQIFFAVKRMELRFHLRPARLRAILRTRDRFARRQLIWTLIHCGIVWIAEVVEFLLPRRRSIHRRAVAGRLTAEIPRRSLPMLVGE